MTTNQQMFILAVEEMSFSKAAERAFVTQQCLSNHIHRLETLYGVQLFERSPRLSLTEAGRTLYKAFTRIRDIEDSARIQLSSSNEEIQGILRIGIHVNRARIFIPDIFEEFHRLYPKVQLKTHFIHTAQIEQMLSEDRIDLGICANAAALPNLRRELIGEENILFVARKDLLQRYIPDFDTDRGTITAEELVKLPFAGSTGLSILSQNVDHFIRQKGYSLQYIFYSDDYQTKLELCQRGILAMFCPEHLFLGTDFSLEDSLPKEQVLSFLILQGFSEMMPLSLISSNHRELPQYAEDFCEILKHSYYQKLQELRSCRPQDIQDYLKNSGDYYTSSPD